MITTLGIFRPRIWQSLDFETPRRRRRLARLQGNRMQHYTRNTVAASAWCAKCQKQTQHRVGDRRIGPCLACIDRLEIEHAKEKAPAPAKQRSLFGGEAA